MKVIATLTYVDGREKHRTLDIEQLTPMAMTIALMERGACSLSVTTSNMIGELEAHQRRNKHEQE